MAKRNHLGHPRPGDPAALIEYGYWLKNEAVKAAGFGQHEDTIAGRIEFESRGATRLFANMSDVATSFVAAANTIDDAASRIIRFANQLADDQASWIRQRTAIDGRMADIDNALAKLPR
jgi:hypothetical protein